MAATESLRLRGRWALMAALLAAGLLPGRQAPALQAQPYELAPVGRGPVPDAGLRLLGSLRLTRLGEFRGISDLAWDARGEVLYAVTDKGLLGRLRPRLVDGRLVDVELLEVVRLSRPDGRRLKHRDSDAEGLALRRDGEDAAELLVSFENTPRVWVYGPDGVWRDEIRIPGLPESGSAYQSGNSMLEGLTVHPRWGVMTAPEEPLTSGPARHVPVFAEHGGPWLYPLGGALNSGLVAMEVDGDGGLLMLERAFVSLGYPLVISLRHTRPDGEGGLLEVRDVAVLSTARGWRLDNFEGLTRHQGQRYFMVSDDNARSIQRTLLVYFELSSAGSAP